MPSPLPSRLPAALSACTRWVLGAWLCVVLAGAFSPLARASGWELLCTASGEALWVASPQAQADSDGALAGGHGLDCPLCMPPLAPAPRASWPQAQAQAGCAQVPARYAQPCIVAALALPPVRAPPG